MYILSIKKHLGNIIINIALLQKSSFKEADKSNMGKETSYEREATVIY